MERERNPFAKPFADWNGLGRRIGWITSQQIALQFKDRTWKENRSRSPLTRIISTLLFVTTALFGGSPFRLVVPPGNSCRAFRNHPANLRVPDSDGVLARASFRSPSLPSTMIGSFDRGNTTFRRGAHRFRRLSGPRCREANKR